MAAESAVDRAETGLREHHQHGAGLLGVDAPAQRLDLVADAPDVGAALRRGVRDKPPFAGEGEAESGVRAQDVRRPVLDRIVGGAVEVALDQRPPAFDGSEVLQFDFAGRHVGGQRDRLAVADRVGALLERAAGGIHQEAQRPLDVDVFAALLREEGHLGVEVEQEVLDRLAVVVAGRPRLHHVGEAGLDHVPGGEPALRVEREQLVEVAHDAAEQRAAVAEREQALGGRALVVGGVRRERAEEVEGPVDDGALGGRDVRDRVGAGVGEVLQDEAGGVVVPDAEERLRVRPLEVRGRVEGEVLEDELLDRELGRRVHDPRLGVVLRERVGRGIVAVALVGAGLPDGVHRPDEIVVPGREEVDEAQTVGEVLRVLQETPAVGHEAVGLGAGLGDLAHRLHFALSGRLGEQVRRAGELRQLRLRVAQGERGGLRFGRIERLEPDLRGAGLGRAVRVDRGLDRHDAAGGERLAAVVVRKQHRLLHGGRDLRLAAEHVGDRLLEERAGAVVDDVLVVGTRPFVDGVVLSRGDGEDPAAAEERLLQVRVRDRLGLAGVHLRLREIRKLLEDGVVSVDVECHGVSPLKS